ncbi:hypothetical protein [Cupriavidus lacunae]|nr:hypothetical protein [Cupriavidus lacunae]
MDQNIAVTFLTAVQAISVVFGVVISVRSFNETKNKEEHARSLDRTLSSWRANALISHGYVRASESITGYRRRG